jgi:hypothetical protein
VPSSSCFGDISIVPLTVGGTSLVPRSRSPARPDLLPSRDVPPTPFVGCPAPRGQQWSGRTPVGPAERRRSRCARGEIEGSSVGPTTSSSFLKPAETREEARLPYSRETAAAGRPQRTAQHRRRPMYLREWRQQVSAAERRRHLTYGGRRGTEPPRGCRCSGLDEKVDRALLLRIRCLKRNRVALATGNGGRDVRGRSELFRSRGLGAL